ncbi:ATP-binding cassette domain-containing protein [Microbacterium maritypicum]
MPDGQVLEFTRVTKRFNDVTAVSDLSARVEPGVVTAFLGPNGAGKTTSLRILLGQVRATSGTATIGGVAYPELRHPLRTIGAVLEETVYRPRRSASRHLTIAAKANGIPLSRVDEVLSLVGLEHEAEGRVGSFSLGMRQRLSVAHALLGDPGALVFDEPANGLDPEGIRWMRLLMRRLADEGRTVLVSSHVLSEIEQVADHVLVLSKGQLVLSSGIETLADPSGGSVVVDSADRVGLRTALASAGFEVEVLRSGLRVRGGDAQTVGAIAASAGVALSTLVQRGPTLEDVFIDLVRGGTLGARGAAAPASEHVVPQEPAPAPVEVEADADAVEADAGAVEADAGAVVVPPIDAAVPGAPASVEGAIAVDAPETETPVEADAPEPTDAEPAHELAVDAEAEPAVDVDRSDEDATEHAVDAEAEPAADVDRSDEDATEHDSTEHDSTEHDDASDAEDANADAPAPSFDDILFGTGSAPDGENPDETADAPAADGSVADASGVEVFDDLGAQDGDDGQAGEPDESDPRSAAVSTMLAAAARAYYDDEPADYPLGDAETSAATPGEDAAGSDDADPAREGDGSGDEAQWSVASTGVIDQVPAWAPAADPSADGHQAETDEHEQSDEHEQGRDDEGRRD